MIKLIILSLLGTLASFAQTTIYYPNTAGKVVQVVSATGTSPPILTTTANVFSAGDVVLVNNIVEYNGRVNQYSALNAPAGSARKICAATSTTVTICDLSGTAVNTSNRILPNSGFIRLATAGTLKTGPRVGMDGWGGPVQMQIAATIRDSTLTNLVTSSGVTTINYAFPHGLPSRCSTPNACSVQVRNATASGNNGIKTVTVVNSRSVTYATAASNGTDTTANLSVSARAIDGQGPWEHVKYTATTFADSAHLNYIYQSTVDAGVWMNWSAAAYYWFVDPSQTTVLSNLLTEMTLNYEDFHPVPQMCGEVAPKCTFANGMSDPVLNYIMLQAIHFAMAYDILRATGQLTGPQDTALKNFILNDNDTGCTHLARTPGSGTITVSGTTMTTSVSTSLAAGSYVYKDGVSIGTSARVISGGPTVYTITANFGDNSGIAYLVASPFASMGNQCGILNMMEHDDVTTGSNDPRLRQQPPPTGDVPNGWVPTLGQWIFAQGNNRAVTNSLATIALASATADDSRGLRLLQAEAAFDYDYHLAEYIGMQGGGHMSGPRYGAGRTRYQNLSANIIAKNSISGFPDFVAQGHTLGAEQQIYTSIYSELPSSASNDPRFIAWLDNDDWSYVYPANGASLAAVHNVAAATTAASYFRWFLEHSMSSIWSTGSSPYFYLGPFMMFLFDPNATVAVDYTSVLPTQVQLYDSEVANCGSMGLTCNAGSNTSIFAQGTARRAAVWSRTSWSAPTTILGQNSQGWATSQNGPNDHAMAIPGNFHIIRNTSGQTGTGVYDGCLVGDNDSNCTFAENAGYDINGWRNSSSLEAGSQLLPNAPQSFGPVLTRWSGPDKFGPTSSSYSSATWDLSGYNQASDGILYSNRTFIHFKKASTDEFVMIFDEVSRTGAYASMNGYTFYPQGAPTGCCTGGTTTFSSGLLTSTNVANQRIMTRWVAPAGANSLAVINDGAFTNPGNGSASAYRLRHCPSTNGSTCNTSATSMEAIQSHYVTTNANSTFASTLISPDSNWACAQVTGASNTKIGCFARRGSTHSTMTAFTPSYSGTAQILITGLSPGTYNILKNGSTIASGQVVASGDNTIYFEASSGTFSVVQTASPSGSASCDVNGDGVVNVVDVQLVIGAALGAIACTPQFDLNQDGSCTIVDVQRVVNASLGLGCRIGP